jgi:hypothetical protein
MDIINDSQTDRFMQRKKVSYSASAAARPGVRQARPVIPKVTGPAHGAAVQLAQGESEFT